MRSIEKGIESWTNLFGYQQASEIVENSRQRVRVVFLSKPCSTLVKLVEPKGPGSPVYAFANRGGGLHHICFRCQALGEELSTLKERGAKLLVPPQPGEAFQDHDIAFLLTEGNLNIELIDTEAKEGWLKSDCEPPPPEPSAEHPESSSSQIPMSTVPRGT